MSTIPEPGQSQVVLYADAQAQIEALQAQITTLKRHAGLDCGDQSCLYALTHSGMRTNGGCRCSPKRTADDLERSRKAVEALQRELDAVIEAASIPTWVCDGCGRVSSDGWINRVTESLDGTDYEMECPMCGVREIEEDCASDLVRERDDLQAALDAEREKLVAVAKERDVQCTLKQNCIGMLEQEREKVAKLHKRLSEEHPGLDEVCDELTQLQVLVRALPVCPGEIKVYPPVVGGVCGTYDVRYDFHLESGSFQSIRLAMFHDACEADTYADLLKHRAVLDATTPGPQTDEQRFIAACCERPDDCKWGGTGGCGYEGRKPKGGDGE